MLAGTIGERNRWRCEALDRAARYISAQLTNAGYAPQVQTFDVTDAVGGGRTSYRLPDFVPTADGDIIWTVTIADQDPDADQVQDVTRVVGE